MTVLPSEADYRDAAEAIVDRLIRRDGQRRNLVTLTREINWQPSPENRPQQHAFELASQVMQLGYGGQAGGGKTDLILGLAGSQFTKSLIVRREYKQLRAVIERGDEIYPVRFVAGDKQQWRFGKKIIALGGLKDERNWTKYQGSSFDLIAFDEAAEIPEKTARYLMGWNRTVIPGQHTLTLFSFNPPTTADGEWIIEYFAPWLDQSYPNPAEPGEIRWFVTTYEDGREKQLEVPDKQPVEINGTAQLPVSRTFIAASRHDNPYLGEAYERTLWALPDPLRTMVMEGDFTLGQPDDIWQAIPTNWVLAAQRRWEEQNKPDVAMRCLGVDVAYGGADRTAIAPLYGTYFDTITTYPGVQTDDGQITADFIEDHYELGAKVMIDVIGYGSSAYDHAKVKPVMRGKVYGVNVGIASHAKDKSGKYRFANLRAEIIWSFREALDPSSGEDIALPPGRDVRVELCTPRYRVVGGKIKIESKQDIIKRLKRSPDKAEAIWLAWAGVIGPPKLRIDRSSEVSEFLGNYRGQTA